MSKELADRMEKVASDLLRDGMLDNAESKIIDEAIAALRSEPVAGQLSAEQIAGIKACLLDGTYTPAEIADFSALCDMALSSLRGTEQCVINPVMSCVCNRGTKSCIISHAKEQ